VRQRFVAQQPDAAPQDGSAAAQAGSAAAHVGPASQQLELAAPQLGSQQPRRKRPAAEAESATARPTTRAKTIARIVGKRFMETSRKGTERTRVRGAVTN
jgi:hypothetical protein